MVTFAKREKYMSELKVIKP